MNQHSSNWDMYSVASFVLVLLLGGMSIFLMSTMLLNVQKGGITQYTSSDIIIFLLNAFLLFILPFVATLIIALYGFKRTRRNDTKGRNLAMSAIIISSLFIILFTILTSMNVIDMSQSGKESCEEKIGICIDSNQTCNTSLILYTECNDQAKICCTGR